MAIKNKSETILCPD